MSSHTPEKTGTHQTDTGTSHNDKKWKVQAEGSGGPLNPPHKPLLLPAALINKLFNPKHKLYNVYASITKPQQLATVSPSC